HVDYWNRLGWKDPFSSSDFSRRQTDYSQALGTEDIYTPQMIVDGRMQFVGSQRATAFDAIAKAARAPKANTTLTIKTTTPNTIELSVHMENVPEVSRDDQAEVIMAITENGLASRVSRGENSDRQLAHSAVTRKLSRIGAIEGNSFSAEPTIQLESKW